MFYVSIHTCYAHDNRPHVGQKRNDETKFSISIAEVVITMETDILSRTVHVKFFLTLSLPREANLTKTSKLPNPDLSDKT